MVKITVGIKALNEEARIAGALESALAAVEPHGGEVILADCGSADRTVEIAGNYPAKIIQLAPSEPPSCGAGAQLAYQRASGEYFYLLDGDQILSPEFITAGIAYLEKHPHLAGVGGLLRERNVDQPEFEIRAQSTQDEREAGSRFVDRLDGGGLYRASALREIGYFADRNLHSFEEFETGARLLARGWELARIEVHAVDHFGYNDDGYRLLWRRLTSGYAAGVGEVVRAGIGQDHFWIILKRLTHVRHSAIVIGWWLLLLVSVIFGSVAGIGVLLVLPLLYLSYRRGSFRLGLYSFASWNVTALGLIMGLFRKRAPPRRALGLVELTGGRRPPESRRSER